MVKQWSKPPAFTAMQLRQMLDYNPETGVLTWRKCEFFSNARNAQFGGKLAGGKEVNGYISIGLNGRWYKAHRLAWFYMTDEWPDDQIDHKNGIRNDNRWINLRIATNQENQFNKNANANNKCGLKGVFKSHLISKPWKAKITKNGAKCHLGYFVTKELAYEAYCNKEIELANLFAHSLRSE